jgi:hypothetical protein
MYIFILRSCFFCPPLATLTLGLERPKLPSNGSCSNWGSRKSTGPMRGEGVGACTIGCTGNIFSLFSGAEPSHVTPFAALVTKVGGKRWRRRRRTDHHIHLRWWGRGLDASGWDFASGSGSATDTTVGPWSGLGSSAMRNSRLHRF